MQFDPHASDDPVHPGYQNNGMVALMELLTPSFILEGIGWLGLRCLDLRDWIRKDSQRQQWGYGLIGAVAVLLMVGIVGLPNGTGPLTEPTTDPKPPPPVVSNDVRFFTYTVAEGDNIGDLAGNYKTTVEQIVEDNMPLFERHTEWCLAKKASPAYYAGRTLDGEKRASETCKMSTFKGKKLAMGTLKVNDNLLFRCTTATKHVPSCSQNAIAAK